MNICDYIKENNITHKIDAKGNVLQNGILDLSNNKITSLEGFIQKGYLDLRNNKITSLKGFVQNGYLDLRNNKITSLEGFKQNGYLLLRNNKITNSKNVFKNPKTNRLVIKQGKIYHCGCFKGNANKFIEKCVEENFIEVLEHFNLN